MNALDPRWRPLFATAIYTSPAKVRGTQHAQGRHRPRPRLLDWCCKGAGAALRALPWKSEIPESLRRLALRGGRDLKLEGRGQKTLAGRDLGQQVGVGAEGRRGRLESDRAWSRPRQLRRDGTAAARGALTDGAG